jgi:arginine repressor
MAAELADLAIWGEGRYYGPMPKYARLEDFPEELGFSEAYDFLKRCGATISEATFARMIRNGRVRKNKRLFSSRPYYRKSELQALLDEETRRVNQDTPQSE